MELLESSSTWMSPEILRIWLPAGRMTGMTKILRFQAQWANVRSSSHFVVRMSLAQVLRWTMTNNQKFAQAAKILRL